MVLRRLAAIEELRLEGGRLEKDRDGSASDVTIPAGWLDLLGEGLALAIEEAARDRADRPASGVSGNVCRVDESF
jgi:hypothetical protein